LKQIHKKEAITEKENRKKRICTGRTQSKEKKEIRKWKEREKDAGVCTGDIYRDIKFACQIV